MRPSASGPATEEAHHLTVSVWSLARLCARLSVHAVRHEKVVCLWVVQLCERGRELLHQGNANIRSCCRTARRKEFGTGLVAHAHLPEGGSAHESVRERGRLLQRRERRQWGRADCEAAFEQLGVHMPRREARRASQHPSAPGTSAAGRTCPGLLAARGASLSLCAASADDVASREGSARVKPAAQSARHHPAPLSSRPPAAVCTRSRAADTTVCDSYPPQAADDGARLLPGGAPLPGRPCELSLAVRLWWPLAARPTTRALIRWPRSSHAGRAARCGGRRLLPARRRASRVR